MPGEADDKPGKRAGGKGLPVAGKGVAGAAGGGTV